MGSRDDAKGSRRLPPLGARSQNGVAGRRKGKPTASPARSAAPFMGQRWGSATPQREANGFPS